MTADKLFDFPASLAPFAPFFRPDAEPWKWIAEIKNALSALDWSDYPPRRSIPHGVVVKGKVHIDSTVILPPFACIEGPAWIGAKTEIRPGAYIRGNVIIGESCVIGNSCEFKNSLILDGAQVPHFNYVGDSILGNHSHLGAGAICANLRIDKKNVIVTLEDGSKVDSGLRKFGAIMGDYAEAGCNSVLEPGAILGRRAVVFSIPFKGYLPDNCTAGSGASVTIAKRRD
jgi:UDP-N-acetylglucosamine diphosphorylase / glucose-1-phosphate thymidylyltransferase / UDP-N-acetylgalactosamine diphosphorylase / glucosamine-1-phosphate N-acetyltransferase / galactosamine-1-phosphate N-acetyltransferase